MSRTVKEWVGKTDDSAAPPRVRLRNFNAKGGKCGICGVKIWPYDEWHTDHKKALKDGGENREGNLQPVHAWCHRRKTATENHERGLANKTAKKHHGINVACSDLSRRARVIRARAMELYGEPGFNTYKEAEEQAISELDGC